MLFRQDQFYEKKETLDVSNNIIFLSIDGVIASRYDDRRYGHNIYELAQYLTDKYHDDIYFTLPSYELGRAYYDWDFSAIGLLRKLIEETRSQIVVHSGWTPLRTLEQIKAYFRLYDLDSFIIDHTSSCECQADAIRDYVDKHPDIDHYLILDDHPCMTLRFGEYSYMTNSIFHSFDDYLYCKRMLTAKFRIQHEQNEDVSKMILYEQKGTILREVADLTYTILKNKEDEKPVICLFHIRSYHRLEGINHYLILLHHAAAYFHAQQLKLMIAYRDHFLERYCHIAINLINSKTMIVNLENRFPHMSFYEYEEEISEGLDHIASSLKSNKEE